MTFDLASIALGAIGGGIAGLLGMGVFAGGRVVAIQGRLDHRRKAHEYAVRERNEERAARDRASDIAGRLQLKMDAIRDLIETPRTIRKGELSAIVNGDAAA